MDRGLTHIALGVADLDVSIDFYARYADFRVVHQRRDEATGHRVAWISDLTRPFVVVLMQDGTPGAPLAAHNHLGVAVADRGAVDAAAARAIAEGRAVVGPHDHGPPVGYWVMIADPDGHNLELAHGQDVGLAVASHAPGPDRGGSHAEPPVTPGQDGMAVTPPA